MVIIDGDSSPVFDHIHVKDAHCGFHMVGGSARITHSVFERLVYGIMAYATAPVIEDSVFRDNANDVGTCLGATAEQAPALEHNHYASGAASIDPSCFQIGTEDEHPAATPNPAAGPAVLVQREGHAPFPPHRQSWALITLAARRGCADLPGLGGGGIWPGGAQAGHGAADTTDQTHAPKAHHPRPDPP